MWRSHRSTFRPRSTSSSSSRHVALAPGQYEVVLAGKTDPAAMTLADLAATPLGADANHPLGQDFAYSFCVNGIEGNIGVNASADDTPGHLP